MKSRLFLWSITAALPAVTDYYADAYMDVDDQMGAPQTFNRTAGGRRQW